MISASSFFACTRVSAGNERNARSTRKNMKLTNWRGAAGGFDSVCGSGAVVVVMMGDLIKRARCTMRLRGYPCSRTAQRAFQCALLPAASDETAAAWCVSATAQDRREDAAR